MAKTSLQSQMQKQLKLCHRFGSKNKIDQNRNKPKNRKEKELDTKWNTSFQTA